jgi:hypothetical protein
MVGSFAHETWRVRWPQILLNAADDNPSFATTILALRSEVMTGPMRMLRSDECSDGAGDDDRWLWSSLHRHAGSPWSDAPFLAAEGFLYRRLLSCVRHRHSGIDPFAARKHIEQQQASLHHDDLAEAVHRSLWANRADLSLPSAAGQHANSPLLVDQTHAAVQALRRAKRVVIVLDNVGHELAADLSLMTHLQRQGCEVVLVAKATPFFVSDATPADVKTLAHRLGVGLPTIIAPAWMSGPLPYASLSRRLQRWLASFDAVVLKGDLNYRRLANDMPWTTSQRFGDAADVFATTVIALRTCKADTLLVDDDDDRARIHHDRQQQPGLLVTGAAAVIQVAQA